MLTASNAAAGEQPAESFARLITGVTARNLIRVFFLMERLKSLGKDSSRRPAHVHVIGAGTMGAGIAQIAATHGHPVRVYDADSGAAPPTRRRGAGRVQNSRRARSAVGKVGTPPASSAATSGP